MTYERLFALIELHQRTRSRELYEIGSVMSLAFNAPKELKTLIAEPIEVTLESVPAMLRPAAKKEST